MSPTAEEQAARRAALEELSRGTTTDAALTFFDSLPAVEVDEVLGSWEGSGLPTGHRLDGVLEALGWHGKRFGSAEDAHPLLFDDSRGRVRDVNPACAPVRLVVRFPGAFRHALARRAFGMSVPLLRTMRPRGRLRPTVYRDVVTATMIYDALPVHDVFRAVDDDTLLGLMDLRDMRRPFFFVLRREG